MKTILRTIAFLSVILGMAACQQYKIDTQMTPEKAAASIKMVCDALGSYTVEAMNPDNITFNVSSNTPWTITRSSGADWCTVTPSSSAMSALISDVVVAIDNNTTGADRSATLTLRGDNIANAVTITIQQSRQGRLYVTPIAQNYSAAGGPLTFTVNTNVDWSVRTDVSWLSFNRENGTPDPDGRTMTIIATAAANEGIARTATVTVEAGDEEESFEVTQNGFTFEIVAPASAELPRLGGSLTLEVNTTATWSPATDAEGWTVEKTDATHFKVTAPANNIFAAKTGKVSISTANGAYDELELTQDTNFDLTGCEVLADGSVKLDGASGSRITTKDNYRYASFVLTMGDKNFGDAGQMWAQVAAGGCNIYTQISLGGNIRIRQDGNLPVAGTSTYKNVNLNSITKEALNAMTEYRFEVIPGTAPNHLVKFWYNGEENTTLDYLSVFADDPTAEGKYWFGFYSATSDGSWYVIKSCDITEIEG